MIEFIIITSLFIICLSVLIYPIIKPKRKKVKLSYYNEREKIYLDIKKYDEYYTSGEINSETYKNETKYLKLQAAKLIQQENNNE